MKACAVSVPLLCCSAPRAVRIIAGRRRGQRCARSPAAARPRTPVIRSTRSGQYERDRRPGPRRTRWSARRCSPRRPGRPGSRCAAGRWPAPGRCRAAGPGAGCAPSAVAVRRGSTTMCVAPVGPARVEVLHGRRHGVGRVGADQQDRRRPRRCRPAGTAARGRRRTPGCRRSPPTTCRTGRCSRSSRCAARPGRTCRACRPSRWSARRRRSTPTRPGRTPAGLPRCRRRSRSSASSQVAGRSGLVRSPGTVRTSGVSSRSGWSSRSAAVQPLEHSPPRLVGKSACGCSVAGRSPATMQIPHCSEQYGQWVRVGVALTSSSSVDRCYGRRAAHLRTVHSSLTASAARPVRGRGSVTRRYTDFSRNALG